jgi:hypothetical protein
VRAASSRLTSLFALGSYPSASSDKTQKKS